MSTQRDEILGCACELFTEEGLEGFSMRRLARSVGVTAPALYRHFDGKEEVLAAVVGEAFKVLSQYLYRALAGTTPLARMMLAGEAYLNFALDHPRYYETIHAPVEAVGIESTPASVAAQACAVGQFWHDRLRELMDEGIIRPDDPHGVSLTMWAHAHGLISLYLGGMLGELDADAFRALYRESSVRVMQGIATGEGASVVEGLDWTPTPGEAPSENAPHLSGAGGAPSAGTNGKSSDATLVLDSQETNGSPDGSDPVRGASDR